jgi:hypothetical protein
LRHASRQFPQGPSCQPQRNKAAASDYVSGLERNGFLLVDDPECDGGDAGADHAEGFGGTAQKVEASAGPIRGAKIVDATTTTGRDD